MPDAARLQVWRTTLTEPLRQPISATDEPSDELLLRTLAEGRAHAFDVLVARHGARVRTYVGRLVGDAAAAEDLTQEVFLKVLTRADRRDPARAFVVWLLHVARNEALDLLRRRARQVHFVASIRAGAERIARRLRELPPRPDQEVARVELHAALERGIAALPEPQRSVFLLREVDGLSYEEIGLVLDCSPKTVSTRLHRARAALRDGLAEHLDGGFPSEHQRGAGS